MEKIRITATLDVTYDYCPITFVKTKLKLEELQKGDILEVFLSNGAAVQNVPRSVKADGHKVILIEKAGDNYRLLIEKGE